MNRTTRHHRTAFFAGLVLAAASAAASPFIVASCRSQRPPQDVSAAVERLRTQTRGGVIPAESVLVGLEKEFDGTRAAALARLLRARARFEANDFAAAASLLDSGSIAAHTSVGDYALDLRARALERLNRRAEARAAYEQLARDFPASLVARRATLRAAELMSEDGQSAGLPAVLKTLADRDDPAALLMTARAHEQQGDSTRALAAYRRLYFYAPAASESKDVAAAIARLNSTPAPATAEEALARAERLASAGRHTEAFDAYTDALARFPNAAGAVVRLRRAASAAQARRTTEAVAALNTIPATEPEARAEALFHLAQAYARGKQWAELRSTAEQMRGAHAKSPWTMRALVAAGMAARDAKNTADMLYFFRTAAAQFPGASEVAGAQFELAWAAHASKNYQESSRLLVEHLAEYADENTDNRGRAGYWAARDTERAGRAAEARALYEAMLARYDANWYGHLSRQRLEALDKSGVKTPTNLASDSQIARAVANLKYVTAAEETAAPEADERLRRADDLDAVGLDDAAHAELDDALKSAPASPRLNLAKARLFRQADKNVEAFNTLRRSYPDYSQMKPEEMSREAWDVFYPLAYWDIITQEARARDLDPYVVAGLIRQESVFNARAASHADAYGLMQLLVPTGRLVAQRYGVNRPINVEALFEPRLNIQLGTGYMRDNLDKFGRIEYVAAAYNAGPHRASAWLASLPSELDEWAEAIPFRETRGYVQGVVRNTLQYRRLYDEQGRFRPEVGAHAVTGRADERPPADVRVRPLRDEEEDE